MEDVSDGIVSSFKPSEKSLRSILSPMPSTSLCTGRDSLSRRRSSASEALVKLRLMNNVPAISRSPPPIKSPPRLFIINFLKFYFGLTEQLLVHQQNVI